MSGEAQHEMFQSLELDTFVPTKPYSLDDSRPVPPRRSVTYIHEPVPVIMQAIFPSTITEKFKKEELEEFLASSSLDISLKATYHSAQNTPIAKTNNNQTSTNDVRPPRNKTSSLSISSMSALNQPSNTVSAPTTRPTMPLTPSPFKNSFSQNQQQFNNGSVVKGQSSPSTNWYSVNEGVDATTESMYTWRRSDGSKSQESQESRRWIGTLNDDRICARWLLTPLLDQTPPPVPDPVLALVFSLTHRPFRLSAPPPRPPPKDAENDNPEGDDEYNLDDIDDPNVLGAFDNDPALKLKPTLERSKIPTQQQQQQQQQQNQQLQPNSSNDDHPKPSISLTGALTSQAQTILDITPLFFLRIRPTLDNNQSSTTTTTTTTFTKFNDGMKPSSLVTKPTTTVLTEIETNSRINHSLYIESITIDGQDAPNAKGVVLTNVGQLNISSLVYGQTGLIPENPTLPCVQISVTAWPLWDSTNNQEKKPFTAPIVSHDAVPLPESTASSLSLALKNNISSNENKDNTSKRDSQSASIAIAGSRRHASSRLSLFSFPDSGGNPALPSTNLRKPRDRGTLHESMAKQNGPNFERRFKDLTISLTLYTLSASPTSSSFPNIANANANAPVTTGSIKDRLVVNKLEVFILDIFIRNLLPESNNDSNDEYSYHDRINSSRQMNCHFKVFVPSIDDDENELAAQKRQNNTSNNAIVDYEELYQSRSSYGIIPLENDISIGPLAPGSCDSVRLRYVALRPGVFAVRKIKLIDVNNPSRQIILKHPLHVVVV